MDIEEARPYLCYPFGVAETLKQDHGIHSLTQLIEERSNTFHEPVIGMPYKTDEDAWSCVMYTYKDILNGVNALCHHFLRHNVMPARQKKDGVKQMVVALVAPSNVDMLMSMLAMQRLGLAVLLITPNQSERVIKHLCAELEVLCIMSPLTIDGLDTISLPDSSIWQEGIRNPGESFVRALSPAEEGETFGVIYHSSGTTSGLPKPLPTKHRFLVSFCAHKHTELATLTTTPLNTGGTADVCRSMCADAMLFLFPDSMPLTTKNVCDARNASSKALGREVKALSCVPYVAKMLAENEDSLKMLQRLEFLGVGGAPLPKATGDFIANCGVPLVSRMGSSECNFLMSSYRDYANDKDWDYLRSEPGGHHFTFLPQNDGTTNCELQVSGSWPALAVAPNHNGNFRTGDLFQPHPTTAHAWLYLGRSDDTIVLNNGKKADPKALEGALRGLTYTKDALVFGVGKENIGVFVIESDDKSVPRGDELRQRIWLDVIRDLNGKAPSHAEVYREMIRILPSTENFQKTPKGTIIRNATYAKLADQINEAYNQTNAKIEVADCGLYKYVTDLVTRITGKELGPDEDLFSAGVNSLHSVRIRNIMVGELGIDMPTNVVFEEPSITRIVSVIRSNRSGESSAPKDVSLLMTDLAKKYSRVEQHTDERSPDRSPVAKQTILLTGVTGGLGAHLLNHILKSYSTTVSKVICLIREGKLSSKERLQETMDYRKIQLAKTNVEVEYIAYDSTARDLGLGVRFTDLAKEVTLIIHAAWPVNFNASLTSFESSIAAVQILLDLATKSRSKFFFCSSAASVINCENPPIAETLSQNTRDASTVGYAQSKWVTEQVVASYAKDVEVGIFRIGQLCGDTEAGVWNESEGWSLMFASVNVIHAMPKLIEDKIAWLPVDIAARSILEISLSSASTVSTDVQIYHIINPNTSTTWNDILQHLKTAGYTFDTVEPSKWVELLEHSPEGTANPSRKLLGLWKSAYSAGNPLSKDPQFSTSKATAASQSLQCAAPVTESLMLKTFQNWQDRGFLGQTM